MDLSIGQCDGRSASWRTARSERRSSFFTPHEQHDEWQVVRRYMSAESLAKARLEVIDGEAVEEVKGELVAAG